MSSKGVALALDLVRGRVDAGILDTENPFVLYSHKFFLNGCQQSWRKVTSHILTESPSCKEGLSLFKNSVDSYCTGFGL